MQDTFARVTHSAGRPSAARNGRVSYIQIVVLCLNKIFLSENYPLDMLYRILNIFNVFAKFPTRNTTLICYLHVHQKVQTAIMLIFPHQIEINVIILLTKYEYNYFIILRVINCQCLKQALV